MEKTAAIRPQLFNGNLGSGRADRYHLLSTGLSGGVLCWLQE